MCVCVGGGAYALTNRAVKPRRRRSAAATVLLVRGNVQLFDYICGRHYDDSYEMRILIYCIHINCHRSHHHLPTDAIEARCRKCWGCANSIFKLELSVNSKQLKGAKGQRCGETERDATKRGEKRSEKNYNNTIVVRGFFTSSLKKWVVSFE